MALEAIQTVTQAEAKAKADREAAVVQAKYSGDKSAIPGMAAMIPAAMVMATVAEPTQILTRAATTKATTTMGRFAEDTAFPIRSPSPEYCSI